MLTVLLLIALIHVAIGAVQFEQTDDFMLLPESGGQVMNGGRAAFTSARIISRAYWK
ncbi:MAG: hypothetical protein WDN28_21050 [Chthoniobacter sp.]